MAPRSALSSDVGICVLSSAVSRTDDDDDDDVVVVAALRVAVGTSDEETDASCTPAVSRAVDALTAPDDDEARLVIFVCGDTISTGNSSSSRSGSKSIEKDESVAEVRRVRWLMESDLD